MAHRETSRRAGWRRVIIVASTATIVGLALTIVAARAATWAHGVELRSGTWGSDAGLVPAVGLPVTWFGEQTTGTIGLTWISAQRLDPGSLAPRGSVALPRWSSLSVEDTV